MIQSLKKKKEQTAKRKDKKNLNSTFDKTIKQCQ